jgi:hypothetical protein
MYWENLNGFMLQVKQLLPGVPYQVWDWFVFFEGLSKLNCLLWDSSWSHPILSCGKQQKVFPFLEGELTVGSPSCLNSSVQCLQLVHFVYRNSRFWGSIRAWAQTPKFKLQRGDSRFSSQFPRAHAVLFLKLHRHSKYHFGGLEGWRVVNRIPC